MADESATSLNIAILPSDEIAEEVIRLNQKIGKEADMVIALDGKKFIPHITVYQAHFPDKNIDRLKKLTKELSRTGNLSEVALSGIISFDTFIFWGCVKTPELQSLHDQAVTTANPLREGLILPILDKIPRKTPEDVYDIETYGSLLIGPRFTPHITITRLKQIQDLEKARQLLGELKEISFKPKALILGYLGDHGTVTGIIESFLL